MGAEMDRLEVQVEAQATKANNQLDKLVSKLDKVSGVLSNLNSNGFAGLSNGVAKFAQASSQLSNVKTADFTRLSKNIEKLSSLNTQQIFSAASSMKVLSTAINSLGNVSTNSLQVAQIAKDISKLGNKNVQTAIANLPALAVAMNDFMTVMAKSPQVSRNIIQMTDALANLVSQGTKVGTVSNSLTRNVNKVGGAMDVNTKRTRGFASAIGSLYQSFFWVSQGVDKLWDSIESSMGYIENLNYFDASFGQVAEAAVAQWEEAGYSSADAYYESFSSRAKELTSRMTGFNINDDGTLTATGDASLGINPSKLMNYQAMFAQMSSSMGVTSETSLKLSQALTEIGADLASVKNMDFDKVWTDMASGLAGMSRTLDKYGANIRNVNLQQKLFDLGINENITNLNQNDKALLRTIILLESTEYAWGDLADTLNMPANQIRLLESNISNLSRTLGNLFLPALSKVLPYVNGFVIAVQRLLTWVGNLMGINLGEITQSIGSSEVNIGELLEDTEGLSGSLDDASDAAKKLKSNLQGFDELNVITTSDDSASGVGTGVGLPSGLLDDAFEDAFSKYQEAWDEAYANMENRAEEFADKIEGYFQPIKDIIGDFAVGDFFAAGQDTSGLVSGIFDFFAEAIDEVDWYEVGEEIGDYFRGIDWLKVLGSVGNLVWQALEASIELWSGMLFSAPLETVLISLADMPNLTKVVTGFKKFATNAKLLTTALAGNKTSTGKLITQYPKLGKAVEVARKAFANFQFGIENGNFLTGLDSGITTIRDNLTGLQKVGITAIAGLAEFQIVSNTFEGLVDGSENVVAGIAKISGAVGLAGAAMYTAFGPAGAAMAGITGLVAAINGVNSAFDEIRAEEIGNIIKNAMSNPGGTPLSEITAQFSDSIMTIGESFSAVTEKSAGLEMANDNIRNTWLEIEKIETAMEAGVMSVDEGTAELTRLFGELATTASEKFALLEDTLLSAFGENGVLTNAYERLGISTTDTMTTIMQLNEKAEQRMQELTSLLQSTDPTNPKYAEYKKEMASLMTQTDELAAAIGNYELALSQIDYSSLTLEDGSLDKDKLQVFLNEIADAVEMANTDIQEAVSGIQASLENEMDLALKLGDFQSAEEIQSKLDALPDALSLLKADVAMKATELTDTIQLDFVEGLNGVIEDAKEKWREKGFWGQAVNGMFGAETESEYVKEAVEEYRKNIDDLSSSIEESFKSLGTDGVVWASDAAAEICFALFDLETYQSRARGETVYTLKENYSEIITEALDGVKPTVSEASKDVGANITAGLSNGILDNSKIAEDAVDEMSVNILSITRNRLGIHSPSTVFYEIGENIAEGLVNGLKSKFTELNSVISEMADIVQNGVKSALDIHSPSRVMYSLGEYTMEGFQLGLENLYGNIQKSISEFGGTLQYNIAPTPQMSFAGIQNNSLPTTEYNNYSYYDSHDNYDATETNGLLRELLSAVRAGHVIECDGRELGRAVLDEDEKHYNRTGKGMFQH